LIPQIIVSALPSKILLKTIMYSWKGIRLVITLLFLRHVFDIYIWYDSLHFNSILRLFGVR